MKQLDFFVDAPVAITELDQLRTQRGTPNITYFDVFDVSNKLRALWRSQQFDRARKLAQEASPAFREPHWLKKYAAQ